MFVKNFLRDTTAVAAVEFAIIAPALLLAYFGMAEVTQGMIAQRRISHVSSTIGDLVAQSSLLASTDIDDIFTVGQAIVSPFDLAPLQMRVSSITANAAGVDTVDWSRGSNMAKLSGTVSVPTTVLGPSASIIQADVTYIYTSPANYFLLSPITFSYTYYMKPRISDQVTCTGC